MTAKTIYFIELILSVGGICGLIYYIWSRTSKRVIQKMLKLKVVENNPDTAYVFYCLERLAKRAQISPPTLYLLEDCAANAFAFRGRGEKWLVLTQGLLQILSKEELEAILSLCIAQIKLKNFRNSEMVVTISLPWVVLGMLCPISLSVIFQTIAAWSVRLFVKPDRMFYADAYAAQLTQNPSMIALALRKMSSLSRRIPLEHHNLAIDHLFLISSIREEENILVGSYDTHPVPEERIRRLLDVSLSC